MSRVCPQCKCDMRVKSAKKTEGKTIFVYTCPNQRCRNYRKDLETKEVRG